MRYYSLVATALAVALTACSENLPLPSEPGSSLNSRLTAELTVSDQVVLVDRVAQLVALSLRSDDIRALVRDAMRRSRVTEHKLVLQDFVRTREGKRFLASLGNVSGTGTAKVAEWIKSLPRLDFYVPARQHRLTWRGGLDAAVASNLASIAPKTAYTVSGELIPLRQSGPVPSEQALFMLQREELKSKRIGAQADVPGSVIQEANDGEVGISYVEANAFGLRGPVIEVADLVEASGRVGTNQTCNPDTGANCGGGGGGGTGPIYTFLKRIVTDGICDNSFCWETNEFEFKSVSQSGKSKTLWISDVPSTGTRFYNQTLLTGNPPFDGTITVSVKETDSSSADDHWVLVIENGPPFYVGPIPVTSADNNTNWPLKEAPNTAPEFDYQLFLFISWPI